MFTVHLVVFRQMIKDVQQRMHKIDGTAQPRGSGIGSMDSGGHHQVLAEIREGVTVVKRDLQAISKRGVRTSRFEYQEPFIVFRNRCIRNHKFLTIRGTIIKDFALYLLV